MVTQTQSRGRNKLNFLAKTVIKINYSEMQYVFLCDWDCDRIVISREQYLIIIRVIKCG